MACDTTERLFHCTADGASKFWYVRVEGARQTVRFGRIGTVGQELIKEFADAAAAQRASEKLVAQKQGRGYVEQNLAVTPLAPPRSPRQPWRQLLLPFDEIEAAL